MKRPTVSLLIFLLVPLLLFPQVHSYSPRLTPAGKGIVKTYIDNVGYWKRMIHAGYAVADPPVEVPGAVYHSPVITGEGVRTQDSPDVPVTDLTNTTQSENSVFISPEDEYLVLNSNNSTDWNGSAVLDLYGADDFYSGDGGFTWAGSVQGAGETNMGDPATAIGWNGWWYVGKIDNLMGQSVAYSNNAGQTWHDVRVATVPGTGADLLDKNHLWIDNSQGSPYEGYLYDAWTNAVTGSANEGNIELCRSTDHGITWSAEINLSQEVYAGSHDQGVNLCTGPEGEVYAVWSVYDSWPSDETALGFAKSLNGGAAFEPATRILGNIRGIRYTQTSKPMRVNSFPSMTVDLSTGPFHGTLYVVWANIGVPGINTGPDIDVYMIRSADKGDTWSSPIRVNQDPPGAGKEHFFPWITCDPETGDLCVIYYDNRECSPTECQTWVSYSYDGGNTWSDIRVSDVTFTPAPIPGLAPSYFGDYIGISSRNRKVYPSWTDNRNGIAMTYLSPFELGPAPGQPWVVYNSYELSVVPGKSRQNMNFGDSLYLSLGIKNIGDQPAIGVTATVTTPSPYILVTDSTENYGTINAGEIKVLPEGYSFRVSDSIPDGLTVRFNVRCSNPDSAWNSHFTVEAHAPALKIVRLNILDTLDGNRNGHLDPGETVDAIITFTNTGDFTCSSSSSTLATGSPYLVLGNDSVMMGDVDPGDTAEAVFTLSVSEEAAVGTEATLIVRATSGMYHLRQDYPETIGLVVEDWETHSFTKFPWEFGGKKQWTLTTIEPYEGIYCSKSGWIYDDQTSELMVTYVSGVDDSISFYRRISSEPNYDFLKFYIDGVQYASWSGDKPWQRFSFPVAAGTHTFKWVYAKDIFLSVGQDCSWLDYIEFPPPPLPTVDPGPDDTTCGGLPYALHGTVADADSILWTTYGDGTFENDTLLSTSYLPGTNDIINGLVRIRLTAFGPYGTSSRSLWLTIGAIPVAGIAVDPKDTVCAGQTITLTTDTINGGTYLWTPGNFTEPEIVVDSATTGGIGTTLFRVTVTNPYGCSASDSVFITFQACAGIPGTEELFSVRVIPNPNPGIFTIVLTHTSREKISLGIYDLLDNRVYEEKNLEIGGKFSRTLDLTGLSKGIYILVIDREGSRISRKIIIQ
jgi:hypothetical protein